MTRMAGANPKIAAIFGGGDFGMDYNKMNNQAYSSQSDLSQAATAADARAYMADKEADNIVEMGKLTAAGIKAGAAGGGGGMACLAKRWVPWVKSLAYSAAVVEVEAIWVDLAIMIL